MSNNADIYQRLSALDDRLTALEKKAPTVAEIRAVVTELLAHEGAEGFSAGLRERAEAILAALKGKP